MTVSSDSDKRLNAAAAKATEFVHWLRGFRQDGDSEQLVSTFQAMTVAMSGLVRSDVARLTQTPGRERFRNLINAVNEIQEAVAEHVPAIAELDRLAATKAGTAFAQLVESGPFCHVGFYGRGGKAFFGSRPGDVDRQAAEFVRSHAFGDVLNMPPKRWISDMIAMWAPDALPVAMRAFLEAPTESGRRNSLESDLVNATVQMRQFAFIIDPDLYGRVVDGVPPGWANDLRRSIWQSLPIIERVVASAVDASFREKAEEYLDVTRTFVMSVLNPVRARDAYVDTVQVGQAEGVGSAAI